MHIGMTDGSQHPAIPMSGMGGGTSQGLKQEGPGWQQGAGGGGGGGTKETTGAGGGGHGLKHDGLGAQQSFCFWSPAGWSFCCCSGGAGMNCCC